MLAAGYSVIFSHAACASISAVDRSLHATIVWLVCTLACRFCNQSALHRVSLQYVVLASPAALL